VGQRARNRLRTVSPDARTEDRFLLSDGVASSLRPWVVPRCFVPPRGYFSCLVHDMQGSQPRHGSEKPPGKERSERGGRLVAVRHGAAFRSPRNALPSHEPTSVSAPEGVSPSASTLTERRLRTGLPRSDSLAYRFSRFRCVSRAQRAIPRAATTLRSASRKTAGMSLSAQAASRYSTAYAGSLRRSRRSSWDVGRLRAMTPAR